MQQILNLYTSLTLTQTRRQINESQVIVAKSRRRVKAQVKCVKKGLNKYNRTFPTQNLIYFSTPFHHLLRDY